MTLDRASKVIESGIERGLHIGAQLYVSQGGKRVADLAFGLAREGVPMTPDTIMLWMSSTKPITAIATGQIWERGKIALDDPVSKYIPEFGAKGKESITVRHVLTHTGGFRLAVGPWTNDPWEQIVAQICDAEIEQGWTIGKTSGYHIASGWYVLGEIVRRVCGGGRAYSQYLREEILEPLGMRDTWIGMPADRWRGYGDRIAPMHFGASFKRPEPLCAVVEYCGGGCNRAARWQRARTDSRPWEILRSDAGGRRRSRHAADYRGDIGAAYGRTA